MICYACFYLQKGSTGYFIAIFSASIDPSDAMKVFDWVVNKLLHLVILSISFINKTHFK